MVYINEWFPNPIGSDAKGEFVELFNAGATPVNLDGWSLWTGGKSKKAPLDGFVIVARGYAVFEKPSVKISLKNTGGGLWLYGPNGALVDAAAFAGAAPEGESFSREDYGAANIEHFAFVVPTPGARNTAINNEITVRNYPVGVALNPPIGASHVLGLLLAASIVILGAWSYIFYKNENLSKLVFGTNAGAR